MISYYKTMQNTIIGSTGLAAVSTTLRKPILYINYTPQI